MDYALLKMERGKKRPRDPVVIFLLGSALFSSVSLHYIIPPILPAMARTFGVSISRAAILVSAYAFSYACSSLFVGPAIDRWGCKLAMWVSLVSFAIVTVVCGLTQSFGLFLVLRIAAGIAAAMLQSAVWTYVAHFVPYGKRGGGGAWVMQAGSVSLIAGVPLGGLVTQFVSWRWVFFLAAAVALSMAFLTGQKLPSLGASADTVLQDARSPLAIVSETLGAVVADGPTRSALIVSFLTWCGYFGLYTYLGAYFEQQLGLDSARVGFATLSVGIGYIFGSQLGGRLSDRLGRRKAIVMGLAWLVFVLAITPRTKHLPLSVIGVFAMGLGFFFTHSAQVPLMGELIPAARGTTISVNYFFAYGGKMAGSAIGGLIMVWWGLPSVGLMSATCCLVAAIVALGASSWSNLN